MNFYPGPSKVYPQVKDWLIEAYETDILSIQHRSQKFMQLYESIIQNLQSKLNIPKDYTIVFTSSATECWHILNDNFSQINAYHFYNGSFGKKWFEYRNANYPQTTFGIEFGINEELENTLFQQIPQTVNLPNIICICQNETSNATQISQKTLSSIRQNRKEDFIFVDATSSFGGQNLNFQDADAWFASVQKCFGLPAGLGIMALSPRLIDFYQSNNKKYAVVGGNTSAVVGVLTDNKSYKRYNELSFLIEQAKQFQTTYTPNVLGIYLLSKVMEFVPTISITSQKLEKRAEDLYDFLEANGYKILILNKTIRSQTVLSIELNEPKLSFLKQKAKEKNIILGNGYGNWKENTFRIANFPQHTDEEFEKLKEFLLL